MKPELIRKNLQKSLLFKSATEEEISQFGASSFISIVPKGDFVYRQGEASNVFYVIALGEAELYVEKEDGSHVSVGRIGPGGHFGETTILINKPRTLAVKALFDLVLICFHKDIFLNQLIVNPRIRYQLDVSLAERLQVSFKSQVDSKHVAQPEEDGSFDDILFYEEEGPDEDDSGLVIPQAHRQEGIWKSKTAKLTRRVIKRFAENSDPYILTGEEGTGKKVICRQIHSQGETSEGMYLEVDLRDFDTRTIADKLFGKEKGSLPFFQMGQTGILEQACGGTVVFAHADRMDQTLQRRLLNAIKSGVYFRQDSDRQIALQCRLVFNCTSDLEALENSHCFLPELFDIISEQHFHVPSLRNHKRDLPRFIDYYLERYNREYGKNIHHVSRDTLGLLMNYDWPGNLSELSTVMQRAVMLSKNNEILSDQILLGLPKTEGKWEFNLLRITGVRKFFESKAYPLVPQLIVGAILLVAVAALFFGPSVAENNIGITISWGIGWPLLFISFFLLARTWCAVCTLATPGILLQALIKPKRKTPKIIKEYSGWIMAVLCVLVLWVEIVWNAYDNPVLSGFIILAITFGSIVFSLFFSRRTWCRYICPLGAINAIFAMPSILEIRSNRHLCLNKCTKHSCFRGASGEEHGCPMFQHPFMVDNNRDCIFCGKCIKNCENKSIHLNLRLAPQELWDIKIPRKADSFLIVSLSAIFFPFAMHQSFYNLMSKIQLMFADHFFNLPKELFGSIIFFGFILFFQIGYYFMVKIQSRILKVDNEELLPFMGYGFIPLVLGAFLAAHFEIFVNKAWRIIPNIELLVGSTHQFYSDGLINAGAAGVLQSIMVFGGLCASMYTTYRITTRLKNNRNVEPNNLMLPFSFLFIFTLIFLFLL